MKSISIQHPGVHGTLRIQDTPIPDCGEHDVLIRVHASGVNRADLLQRQGHYPPPSGESDVLGLEAAGEVVAIGKQVSTFKPRDKVYALLGSGGYAEYCKAPASLVAPIPPHFSYVQAAGIAEALTTVHASAFMLGHLSKGQTLLMHAIGSGITSLAVQMAQHIGAIPIATARSERKFKAAQTLFKALEVIPLHRVALSEALSAKGVDVIVDCVGKEDIQTHLNALKPEGTLVQIAAMSGRHATLNLLTLMQKRLHLHGFTLRSQHLEEKAFIWQSAQAQWSCALETGAVQPVIDSVFSYQHAQLAHERMLASEHFGKIILEWH